MFSAAWIDVVAGIVSALAATAGIIIAILKLRGRKQAHQQTSSYQKNVGASVWDGKMFAPGLTPLKIVIYDRASDGKDNRGWTVQIAADKPFSHVMGHVEQTTQVVDVEPSAGLAEAEGGHEVLLHPRQFPLTIRCRIARRGEGVWSEWSDSLTLKAQPGCYRVEFTSH